MTGPRWRWLTLRVMLAGRAAGLKGEWDSAFKADKAPDWTAADADLWAAMCRGAGHEQAPMVHSELDEPAAG